MSTKLPSHLVEARRLLDGGIKLVQLVHKSKRPIGEGWNKEKNCAVDIDHDATGYGIPLAVNGLCSVDPDNLEAATIGLKALGFELEDIMSAGVRTVSSREGSGGRSAFRAVDGLTWIKFSSKETGTALEFRAQSPNLQDCCPGVVYLDSNGNECSQEYDPFTEHNFDNPPELPQALQDWWLRCSSDVEFLREQQTLFFAALGFDAHRSVSAGKTLAFPSRLRVDYNKANSVESILERHGYTQGRNGRWAPSTATGEPCVRHVPGTDNLWHSDHASDPLFGNFDAWCAYVMLDHNGDQRAAESACGDTLLDMFEAVDTDTGVVAKGFEALLSDAEKVTTREDFQSFTNKVCAIKKEVLSDGDRTVLAGVLASLPYFKGKMTKAEIKKELAYSPPLTTNRPKYERDDEGTILNTVSNVVLALKTESEIKLRLAQDTFTDTLKFTTDGGKNWITFADEHYVLLAIRLEQLGIYGCSTQRLRECVYSVGIDQSIDSAQIWINTLKWDGVNRIERFYIDYFGAEDTPYARAVGLYTWTALAGRVLSPGIQADMIPVLVGMQGVRKSTGIKAISPAPEFFAEFNFGEPENESARKMRGTLVGELAELRGLRSREKEHIKGWVTRTHEQYRPVYKEFVITFPRRLVFFGSTNDEQFLDEDTSGQRRWLPINVSRGEVEKIAADCLQLWAEGVRLFLETGTVSYQDAESLAKDVHANYTEVDPYQAPIVEWLETRTDISHDWVTTDEIMGLALDLDPSKRNSAHARRVGAVLKKLKYKHKQITSNGKKIWVFFPTEST